MKRTYNEPTILIILGATGDLSRRKLLPSLFDLFEKGLLPDALRIVGFARTPHSDDNYREIARKAITERGIPYNEDALQNFLTLLSYQPGNTTIPKDYTLLGEMLHDIERELGQCSNKIFYLALSPELYEETLTNLASSSMTPSCSTEKNWVRILLEKPFGSDTKTAEKLNTLLGKLFSEKQIFRIDHYLAKRVLQDILMFRFSNLIFGPVWNKDYIEKMEIKLYETLGTEGRGAFYETVGALRDVGQNHLLQMLALATMENPVELEANSIRKERTRIFSALRPIDATNIEQRTVRGQYRGYRDEKNVDPHSETETYFKIKAYIDNDTWRDVPFFLESGKGLGEKKAEIVVHFKEMKKCLCQESESHHQNTLTFRIQPDEGIKIRFWASKNIIGKGLEPKDLSFFYQNTNGSEKPLDAYEHILLDAITGEQMLFTSTEELSASWKFITPIVQAWKQCELIEYEHGSNGPEKVLL